MGPRGTVGACSGPALTELSGVSNGVAPAVFDKAPDMATQPHGHWAVSLQPCSLLRAIAFPLQSASYPGSDLG